MHKRPHLEQGDKIYQYIKDRRHIAWIARLRTEYYALNKYLHRLNIIDDPNCECVEGHEMVEHYLLKYALYEEKRERMRKEMRIEGMRVSKLLGDPKLIRHAKQYVIETKIFDL